MEPYVKVLEELKKRYENGQNLHITNPGCGHGDFKLTNDLTLEQVLVKISYLFSDLAIDLGINIDFPTFVDCLMPSKNKEELPEPDLKHSVLSLEDSPLGDVNV